MEDDDEFEVECMALEAIFSEQFRREEGRKICVKVEPVTPEGETLEDWAFSLILEVPDNYPEEIPVFKVASLENTIYSAEAKRQLGECLESEASGMIGEQMIYNLVEWLREHLVDYVALSKQDMRQASNREALNATDDASSTQRPKPDQPKKEKMTKAQKRRFYTRFGVAEEKPRGWNWVDIIAHLSSRPPQQQQGN